MSCRVEGLGVVSFNQINFCRLSLGHVCMGIHVNSGLELEWTPLLPKVCRFSPCAHARSRD